MDKEGELELQREYDRVAAGKGAMKREAVEGASTMGVVSRKGSARPDDWSGIDLCA